MVKPIIHDTIILSAKSRNASRADLDTARDLMDTLRANADICVGMAANMIGVSKRILVFSVGPVIIPMLNPVIIDHSAESYETEEGCLCHMGTRKTRRWNSITVSYMDLTFKKCRQQYSGFTAQIIQHEMDHFEGILI